MMLRIAAEEVSPEDYSLREGCRRSSPFSPIKSFSRRSFPYDKLPEVPIRLSILKLDGSSFDVNVMTWATVGDLMEAIEDVFSYLPDNGPAMISWSHVWGHFCLCFDGQKLLNETDSIASYGIKDGDQLQFIRHVSSNSNEPKEQSRNPKVISSQMHMCRLIVQPNKQMAETIEYSWRNLEKESSPKSGEEDEYGGSRRFLISGFLGGWFLHSPLPDNSEDSDGDSNSSLRDECFRVLWWS